MSLFNLFKKGITVELYNLTGEILSNISFEYQQGKKTIESLAAHKQYSFVLIPAGESDLRLLYQRSGKKLSHTINTYFDKNYTGELILKVNSGDTIDVIDNIKV